MRRSTVTELMKYNSHLMLSEAVPNHQYCNRDGQSRSHFATPYNFCERAEVRVVSHQIIIDAMNDEGQVKGVKCPNNSEYRETFESLSLIIAIGRDTYQRPMT